MRPKRIILIRHGESEGNLDRSRYHTVQDFALKLSSTGIQQAQQAGMRLKEILGDEKVYVYLSPFFRTRETFQHVREAIKQNVVKSIEDPRIREQDWGHLRHPDDNKGIIEERDNFSTFYYRIPDGESGADVYDRVSSFLDTLHRDFKKESFPENVLIVSHGLTMRLFLMRWFHWSVEEFESLHNPKNCQIVIMERQPDNHYILSSELSRK
ncbi:histidine phosphatase family protein [Candidatus Villigracilis affinis]|uniref:histidine phosphatase family protein n=1 Tax=Candidatus Villigracilis affinis TaxID=3140682 RepID=UPI002A1AC9FE|nr:histidine phosphatase family protein [Anaerolineales bacterium]